MERDYSISWIRLLSALSIIICHIFQFYGNDLCAWFNVGVQLFFIISGYLYGMKREIKTVEFIKKTFKKVLIPFWLFLIFAILYFIVIPNSDVNLSIKSIGLAFLGAETLPCLRYLWFIPYILFCYLVVPYLYAIKEHCRSKSLLSTLAVYMLVVLLVQVLGFAYKSFFLPDRVIPFIVAFFLPDIFDRIGYKSKIVVMWLIVVAGSVAWIIRYFVRYCYTGQYIQIAGLYDRYSMVFAALAIFVLLKLLFKNTRNRPLLSISDKLSYHIYLVHGLFIFGPVAILTVTPLFSVNIVLLFSLILLLAVLLERVSNMINNVIIWK